MGSEMTCRAVWGKLSGDGKVLLETNEILFRGPFRLKIPLKSISALEARAGKLHVSFTEGKATFHLGPAAEKWLEKIQNPRSLLDKLGVKPESRVGIEGLSDPELLRQIQERVPETSASDCDILFLAAEDTAALKRLGALQKRIKKNGAIWVIYPKGQKHITELGVIVAGKAAGLVDVKIASISVTHTGMKMMIPVSKR